MRILPAVIGIAFLFGAPLAFADNFTVLEPAVGTIVNEGDQIKIYWQGEISGTESGSGNPSLIMTISLVPAGGGGTPIGIATVDVTTNSYLWQVPPGITGFFGGLDNYQLAFTRDGQTDYSSTFSIVGAASAAGFVNTNNITSYNGGTFTPYTLSYSPYLSVGSGGVYTPTTANAYVPYDPSSNNNGTVAYNQSVYTPPTGFDVFPTDWSSSTTPLKTSTSTISVAASSTEAASVSRSACIDLQSDLFLGIETDVTSLQQFLAAQGDFSYTQTGFFGLHTESAVEVFQKANGISPTGYVGPLTRAKIKALSCNANG